MTALLTLLGALVLFLLQRHFYMTKWSNGLDARIQFQEAAATEGDTALLTETIINRNWLPLVTLQVKFSISKYLKFEHTENTILTDQNYRNDIFSIASYEKITRKLSFVCQKRGYYHVNNVDLISSDIFLTEKLVTTAPQNTAFYVYPKAVDTAVFEIPFKKLMGTILTRRYTQEDPFEFRGIRPYEIYDSMKDINWKASARTGELKVNQHNYTSNQKVTILLNLASDSNWKYEKLYEESIRIAAAFVNGCISNGIPVGLITNGTDCISHESLSVESGAGEGHRITIIQRLARIDDQEEAPEFTPYIQKEMENIDSSSIYILISRVQSKELLDTYSALCMMNPGSQWIAPLHPDMEHRYASCPNAISMKWEVPYVS